MIIFLERQISSIVVLKADIKCKYVYRQILPLFVRYLAHEKDFAMDCKLC